MKNIIKSITIALVSLISQVSNAQIYEFKSHDFFEYSPEYEMTEALLDSTKHVYVGTDTQFSSLTINTVSNLVYDFSARMDTTLVYELVKIEPMGPWNTFYIAKNNDGLQLTIRVQNSVPNETVVIFVWRTGEFEMSGWIGTSK